MNSKMLILGREPALWLAVAQAVLGVVVGFGLDGLSAEQAALWMAFGNALFGVIQAILTRPWAVSVFTHAFAVLVTLGAAYGLDLSQPMVASINLVIVSVLALIARGEISPTPQAWQTGVMGNKVTTDPNQFRR